MNDPDDFLTRWARRKRAATNTPEEANQPDASRLQRPDRAAPAAGESKATPAGANEPLVDLTQLPSIESIAAETDIRGFFAPGVPAELTRAALRRAWVADPKVRDFVGLNDYDFDFHTPGAIPGFGPLEMTDDLRREVARIVGNFLPEDPPSSADTAVPDPTGPAIQPPSEDAEINEVTTETVAGSERSSLPTDQASPVSDEHHFGASPSHKSEDVVAVQQNTRPSENLQTSARRSHGSALPK